MAVGAGFTRIVQQDLSAGMFPALAPELIPANGAFDITNGLLSEQNVCYRRGGSVYLASSAPNMPPRMLWSGLLEHGHQTILCTSTGSWKIESDGELKAIALTPPTVLIGSPTVFQGVLYLPGGVTWDGENAGTVHDTPYYATAGNRLLCGSGARIVVSNVPKREGEAPIFEETTLTPTLSTTENSAVVTVSTAAGVVVGMPILCGAASIPEGTTVKEISGTTLTLSAAAERTTSSVACSIGNANFLSLPEGVSITGMQGWRTSCVVFTTEGIWMIGGLDKELTDAAGNIQWTQDRYSADAVLWGETGVAGWKGGLVVPCKDDVWLMELGVSSEKSVAFRSISQAIQNVYRGYVAAGHKPGCAVVFNGHYFLPILGLDGETTIDMLVCRLEGISDAGKADTAWTRLRGYGADLAALATTVNDLEGPLIGATADAARVLSLAYFSPSAAVEDDANGESVPFEITTRSIPTGNLVPNLVAKLRVSYRMVAPPDTTIDVGFNGSAYGAEWGAFNWGEVDWVSGTGSFEDLGASIPPAKADPESVDPKIWHVGRKVRFARMRISLSGPASQLSIRAIELFVRLDGRAV